MVELLPHPAGKRFSSTNGHAKAGISEQIQMDALPPIGRAPSRVVKFGVCECDVVALAQIGKIEPLVRELLKEEPDPPRIGACRLGFDPRSQSCRHQTRQEGAQKREVQTFIFQSELEVDKIAVAGPIRPADRFRAACPLQ